MPDQNSACIVDWGGLLDQFRGREAAVTKVAGTVLRTQSGVPDQLRAMVAIADFAGLAQLGHSIKGMGGNLMAHRLFELGKQVDEAARAENPAALTLASELADAMQTMLDEVRVKVGTGG